MLAIDSGIKSRTVLDESALTLFEKGNGQRIQSEDAQIGGYVDIQGMFPKTELANNIILEETYGEEWALTNKAESSERVTLSFIPKLEGIDKQDPVLTQLTRKLLRALWATVVSRALQVSFPIQKTKLQIFDDPEEGTRRALLHVSCNATVSQTLAFWDSLDMDLQNWLNILNDYEKNIFITTLGLRFHWR